jgi:hypothetical protein
VPVRGFDFLIPEQFLQCLWQAQFGRNPDPAIHERFWQRDLAIVDEFHDRLLFPLNDNQAVIAANNLIARLAEDKHPRGLTKVTPATRMALHLP